jgi:hypothetical protein
MCHISNEYCQAKPCGDNLSKGKGSAKPTYARRRVFTSQEVSRQLTTAHISHWRVGELPLYFQ